MRLACSLMVLGLCALVTGCDDEEFVCPDGYVRDGHAGPGYCRAEGFLDALEDEGDVVVYGFAKTIEGGCGPGDTTCRVELVAGLPVEIYDLDDLEAEAGPDACRDGELVDATGNPNPSPLDAQSFHVTPVLAVETDDEGRWWSALQPGRWCFSAIDPIDGSRQAVAHELGAEVRLPIDWVFDHGGY